MYVFSVPRFTLLLTLAAWGAVPNNICAQCGLMPLVPPDTPSMQDFGAGVAVDGDTLVVANARS